MSSVRRLPPVPSISDILRIYEINAKKNLSQNFIIDPKILNKLATIAGDITGKTIVEVGPGPGGLTRAILANGAREVHVIEKDDRFKESLELLQEVSGNLIINIGDVLKFNMSKMFPNNLRRDWNGPRPELQLIGNLPFNISTHLTIRFLRSMSNKDSLFSYGRVPLTLVYQKEVAERMIAPPENIERSRLSVLCQNYAEVNYKYTLKGGSFVPKPEVDAGVVVLVPLREPYIDMPFKFVEKVVTSIFMGKQKQISNSFRNLFPKNIEQSKNVFKLIRLTSLDYQRTSISLNMGEIKKVCIAYKDMCDRDHVINNYVTNDCLKQTLDFIEKTHTPLIENNNHMNNYLIGGI